MEEKAGHGYNEMQEKPSLNIVNDIVYVIKGFLVMFWASKCSDNSTSSAHHTVYHLGSG